MSAAFTKLNTDWNAQPNAPMPAAEAVGPDLVLTFLLNSFLYPRFYEGQQGMLTFRNCWRYRLGATNDEGWHLGQCRFSNVAPAWGEFYEVNGDLKLERLAEPWTKGPSGVPTASRHFLFYFRDETFECDAAEWNVSFL